MKIKNLRLASLAMSVVMTMTALPSTAFAAEDLFTSGDVEGIEATYGDDLFGSEVEEAVTPVADVVEEPALDVVGEFDAADVFTSDFSSDDVTDFFEMEPVGEDSGAVYKEVDLASILFHYNEVEEGIENPKADLTVDYQVVERKVDTDDEVSRVDKTATAEIAETKEASCLTAGQVRLKVTINEPDAKNNGTYYSTIINQAGETEEKWFTAKDPSTKSGLSEPLGHDPADDSLFEEVITVAATCSSEGKKTVFYLCKRENCDLGEEAEYTTKDGKKYHLIKQEEVTIPQDENAHIWDKEEKTGYYAGVDKKDDEITKDDIVDEKPEGSYTALTYRVCLLDESHIEVLSSEKYYAPGTLVRKVYIPEGQEKNVNLVKEDGSDVATGDDLPENKDDFKLKMCMKPGQYWIGYYESEDAEEPIDVDGKPYYDPNPITYAAEHTDIVKVYTYDTVIDGEKKSGEIDEIVDDKTGVDSDDDLFIVRRDDNGKITEVIGNKTCKELEYKVVEKCVNTEGHDPKEEVIISETSYTAAGLGDHTLSDPSKSKFDELAEKYKAEDAKMTMDEYEALKKEISEDSTLKNEVTVGEPTSTCVEEGTVDVSYKCTVCGQEGAKTQTFKIEKTPHKYGDPVETVVKEATCTESGTKKVVWTCTVCGKEESKEFVIDPLGHAYDVASIEFEYDGQVVVDSKNGHLNKKWEADKDKEDADFSYDANSDTLYTEADEDDDKLGVMVRAFVRCSNDPTHKLYLDELDGEVEGVTDKELEELKKNEVTTTYSDAVVDETSCNAGEGTIKLNTVIKNGETEVKADSREFTYYTSRNTFQQGNKHIPDPEKITNVLVEPTLDTPGQEEVIVKCLICGAVISRKVNTIAPIEDKHENMEHKAEVAATCTEDGTKEYWYCDVCKKFYADENAETEIAEEDLKIPATGHKIVVVDKVEPTCTEAGSEAHFKCEVCEKLFSDAEGQNEIEAPVAIEALGHEPKDPVEEEREDGKYNVVYCNRCGEEISAEKIEEVTPTITPTPVVEAPAKAEITATQANDKKGVLKVTVKKLADATAYEVGYKEAGTKGYTTETFDSNKASFSGVAKDKLYRIRARGINDGGEGEYGYARRWMHSVTFTLKAGKGTLTVNIKDTDTSEKYQIRYADNADLNNYKVLNTKSTTATISGLTAGTKYYVRVVPYKRDADGIRYTGVLSNQRAKAAK